MTVTKTFCDFCKKEVPNIPYAIDIKRVYGDLDVLQTFDCCRTCMEGLIIKYIKGGGTL